MRKDSRGLLVLNSWFLNRKVFFLVFCFNLPHPFSWELCFRALDLGFWGKEVLFIFVGVSVCVFVCVCCGPSWVIMSALTPPTDMPTPTTDKITQAAMETIYLCKFRVSMDGEWLCLRELDDISLTPDPEPTHEGMVRTRPLVSHQRPHCYSKLGGSGRGRKNPYSVL